MTLNRAVFVALFAVGLAIRLVLLPYHGTGDMDVDLQWGRSANASGLGAAFGGIYLPVEYQLFQLAVFMSQHLGIGGIAALKAINLVFDVATFVVLVALLRRWRLSPGWALLYWLHPYFLVLYWLGYVDAHIGFCLLLAIYLAGGRRPQSAGIPLAFAFMMKPQATFAVAMVALWGIVALASTRRFRDVPFRAAALLVPTVALTAVYTVVIALTGGYKDKLEVLYIQTGKSSPALTYQMLNIWYPVANLYRHGQRYIFFVNGPSALTAVGYLATAVIFVAGATAVWRRRATLQADRALLVLFLVAAVASPLLLVGSHESHFFNAAVLGVPALALLRRASVTWLFAGYLAVHAAHIFLLYGMGQNHLTTGWALARVNRHYYTTWNDQQLVAAVSFVLLAALAVAVRQTLRGGRPRAAAP